MDNDMSAFGVDAFAESRKNKKPAPISFRDRAYAELTEILNLLCEKNSKYGNSALEPMRVFSKADSLEQLKVRIDDKLSRIKTAKEGDEEDPILDLIGYLVLYRMAIRQKLDSFKDCRNG